MQPTALIVPERYHVPDFPTSLGNMEPCSARQLGGTVSCPAIPSAMALDLSAQLPTKFFQHLADAPVGGLSVL